jgi:DNA repair ATPase RecN
MPELQEITDEVATWARDVAYVAVGLGVLGFQRAQVERRQLQQRLGTDLPHVEGRLADVRSALPDLADVRSALPDLADVRSALPDLAAVRSALPDLADVRSAVADLADLRSAVATSLQRLDEVVEEATQLIESTLEPLEHQMPAAARELTHRALQQAREVGGQLRGLAGPSAA